MSPKIWIFSYLTDEKEKKKIPYLNASKQAERKVQYNPYYVNIEDSI